MGLPLLGAMGMVGALMLLGEGLLRGSGVRSVGPLSGASELLYLGGWACSLVGMGRSGAVGRGQSGRAVLFAQGTGLCLAATFTAWETVTDGRAAGNLLYEVTNAAWPLSHLFMIAVGAATLRARVWRGWRRFAPLACGLALPASALSGAVGMGGAGGPFATLTAAAFFLLGYAVATGGAASAAIGSGALERA